MEAVENKLKKAWKSLMNAQNTLKQVKFEMDVQEYVKPLNATEWIIQHG